MARGVGRLLDMRALCVALAIAVGMEAQSLPERRFEAASVKPSPVGGGRSFRGGPGTSSPGQISYGRVSLKDLLFSAFRVQSYSDGDPALDG